ncbi:hypothetical protein D1Z68_23695, partial [Escherichia coli]|nr:hypothetical protein [Escherichia coli]
QIARENGVNDNVIFKWLRLWQNEGRISRRLPVTTSSDTGVELLPEPPRESWRLNFLRKR